MLDQPNNLHQHEPVLSVEEIENIVHETKVALDFDDSLAHEVTKRLLSQLEQKRFKSPKDERLDEELLSRIRHVLVVTEEQRHLVGTYSEFKRILKEVKKEFADLKSQVLIPKIVMMITEKINPEIEYSLVRLNCIPMQIDTEHRKTDVRFVRGRVVYKEEQVIKSQIKKITLEVFSGRISKVDLRSMINEIMEDLILHLHKDIDWDSVVSDYRQAIQYNLDSPHLLDRITNSYYENCKGNK